MTDKKDYNKIAKIEKAIAEKYGKEATKNPKSGWNQQKEKEHLKSLKKFYKRKENKLRTPKEEKGSRTCPVCETYSLDLSDDIYMSKYCCCFRCFIQYVEDREERWLSGWRP